MIKNRMPLFLGLIVICVSVGFLSIFHGRGSNILTKNPGEADLQAKTISDAKAAATARTLASINQAVSKPSGINPQSDTRVSRDYYKKYFEENLLGNRKVQAIYKSLKAKLPGTEAANLIAIYAAEGIARNDSHEFYDFMMSYLSALNEDPQAVSQALLDNASILKENPFVYQMSLNLVHSLNISSDQKAAILGQAFNQGVTFDKNGQISPFSTNISTALILMKQSGVTAEQANTYVQNGLAANQGNPQALDAFTVRAQTYYPELFAGK